MKTKSIFRPKSEPTKSNEVAKSAGITITAIQKPQFPKEIPAHVESKLFCANVDGKTFRFVRSESLLGFEPGHIYTLNVDQDNSAYVITTIFDNTLSRGIDFNGRNLLQIRCTSQTSFYNYFQPVWQNAEEAV
jgi:hypothetical protein